MSRQNLEVPDIFRRHGEAWRRANDASGLGCQLQVQAFQWTLDLPDRVERYTRIP
jgi:hypothetical protein